MKLQQQLGLWATYAGSRISGQLAPIMFVIIYLLGFQVFLFNIPITAPINLILGGCSILVGLALFLEAVNLCVMPLAETTAFTLKNSLPIFVLLAFALLLGAIAAIAEPAVSVFRTMESTFEETDASFIAHLLRHHMGGITIAIAVGVGMATVFGAFRAIYHWSMKSLLSILTIVALLLSIFAYNQPQTAHIISLSWDTGGIATGPITVSFMIAFGIGLCKGEKQDFSGMGIVGLASLTPVIFVLATSLFLYYTGDSSTLATTEIVQKVSTNGSLWQNIDTTMAQQSWFWHGLWESLKTSLPIVGIFVLIVVLFTRKKPDSLDVKVLGFLFLLGGSFLFMDGIQKGLLPLGETLGGNITRLISAKTEATLPQRVVIQNFDLNMLQTGVDKQGKVFQYFYLKDHSSKLKPVVFDPELYNAKEHNYTYIPEIYLSSTIKNKLVGYAIIVLFSLGLGIALTAVEPTLITLAKTLEENTAGVIQGRSIIRLVAIGAGVGMSIGVLRLLLKIPFPPIIIGVFTLLLVLTLISRDDFVEIAWDAAGCTTGPITIPLAIALELGINKNFPSSDIFGMIALTNAAATIGVLAYGLRCKYLENKKFNEAYDHE